MGSPISHSLSPTIFNAAFESLSLDLEYVAVEVPPGRAEEAIDEARALGVMGLSVTMPHKASVLPALDRLSAAAEALGAVNTVLRVGDELVGDNTDGPGFLDALAADEGFDPAGRRCVVFGAGGAARAVILALAAAGAAEVSVVNRNAEHAEVAVLLAGAVGRIGEPADVKGADLIVNATPIGMQGQPAEPLFETSILAEGQLVADLVYHPSITPLVAEARSRGARAVNGLGMLIHQAGHSFQLWTGQPPPLSVMSAAAVSALRRDGR
ncbi:MAG TPA: shikimate dehydrogenase [Acidimicrobiales bacterium]|nr:shikimate dehydrogenase [Acidimicrobiales bacterium]